MSEQPARSAASVHQCGHESGCTNPATHQAQRTATPDEAQTHWDNLERHIRESDNPDYTQNRDDTVTIADFRCDDHAHPARLEALANQDDTPQTA